MKLSMLPIVERAAYAHKRLIDQIDCVERGHYSIGIDGERQDEAMMAVAKLAIIAELRARKASLERDLEAYGVKLD